MKSELVLVLDLSLNSTGYCIRDRNTKEMLRYGVIAPHKSAGKGATYPEQQLRKMQNVSEQILNIIRLYSAINLIVLEEINGGTRSARLSQKTLDGMHYVLMDAISRETQLIKSVLYYDSDGAHGWRSQSGLNLNLSKLDKLQNAANKKLNKKMGRGQKLPIITKKTLSIQYVNKKYALGLVESKGGDDDIADAIGLSDFYLDYVAR